MCSLLGRDQDSHSSFTRTFERVIFGAASLKDLIFQNFQFINLINKFGHKSLWDFCEYKIYRKDKVLRRSKWVKNDKLKSKALHL